MGEPVGRPEPEEVAAVMCALYRFCSGSGCHVAPEKVRRLTRMTGDRFNAVWSWLTRKGLIWCKSHGHRESCGPTKRLLRTARERCPELWSQL